MIPLAVFLVFGFVVAFTGPAFDEERAQVLGILGGFLERRQLRLDAPTARALALPPAREDPTAGRCMEPGCAICQARQRP